MSGIAPRHVLLGLTVLAATIGLPGTAACREDSTEPPVEEPAEAPVSSPAQASAAGPAQGERARSGSLPLGDGAADLTGELQGKEGLRIQTLCTHCNSANIQAGGLSQELAPITRDGFPVVGGLAATFLLSVLPADAIADANVVKGPGEASMSPTAAGGAIALTAATPEDVPWLDLLAETGSYSLRRGVARISGSMGRVGGGTFTLGRTTADPVDDDGDGWVDVPAVDRDYADGNLEIRPGASHVVSFGVSYINEANPLGRGAFDALRYILEGLDSWTREDIDFRRAEFRTGWEWEVGGDATLALRALGAERRQTVASQVTGTEVPFIPGATEPFERFEIEERNLWLALQYRQLLGLDVQVAAGVESNLQEVDAQNREPLTLLNQGAVEPELAFESVDLVSAWADVIWAPNPRLELQVGVRYDTAEFVTELTHPTPTRSARADHETSPRISVRYYPARGWTLRFLAGDTFRPPRPILSEVCCGQRYQTTEAVLPEVGTTSGLEVSFQPTPRLRASAFLARTDFDNYILRVVGWSQVFIQTYALANIPQAQADRFELALRWTPLPRLTVDGSMGWLSFHNTGNEKVDVFVTPPSSSAIQVVPISIGRVPYRPVRTASVGLRWAMLKRVVGLAQASYTGGMPIQQYIREPFNSQLDTEGFRPTPAWWLVNLSVEIPVSRHVSLLAALNNVTDELQDDLGDPTTDYNWGPLAGRSWTFGVRGRLDR